MAGIPIRQPNVVGTRPFRCSPRELMYALLTATRHELPVALPFLLVGGKSAAIS